MKKLFISLLFCSFFSLSVMAQKTEHFFYQELPGWLILGEKDNDKKLLICSMETGIKNKNVLDFGYTFIEGYFYLVISSENLNLQGLIENQRYEARLSLVMQDGKIESAPAGFVKLNDNTVMIPHVIPEAFFPYFLNSKIVKIDLPQNRGSTEISVPLLKESFRILGDCADKAQNIIKNKEQGI